MFLILAHAEDPTALQVGNALIERHGHERVRMLTAEDLVLSTQWSHRQEGQQVKTLLRLADGLLLSSDSIKVVFNRLRYITMPHFDTAKAVDRDYAVGEMFALLLSWLASFSCPVVNRASVRGLGGAEISLAEWLLLAGKAGLPTRQLRFTTNSRLFFRKSFVPYVPSEGAHLSKAESFQPASVPVLGKSPALFLEPVAEEVSRILVVGNKTCPDVKSELTENCLRLARMSGCDLIECFFARPQPLRSIVDKGEEWSFCNANHFRHALDGQEVAAIVEMLESKAMEEGEEVKPA